MRNDQFFPVRPREFKVLNNAIHISLHHQHLPRRFATGFRFQWTSPRPVRTALLETIFTQNMYLQRCGRIAAGSRPYAEWSRSHRRCRRRRHRYPQASRGPNLHRRLIVCNFQLGDVNCLFLIALRIANRTRSNETWHMSRAQKPNRQSLWRGIIIKHNSTEWFYLDRRVSLFLPRVLIRKRFGLPCWRSS